MGKEYFAIVRDVVVLGAILLFGSGWMVTYFYFLHFGIPLNSLGWPYHAFYMYSLLPLTHVFSHSWYSAAFIIAAVLSPWLYYTLVRRRVLVLLGTFVILLACLYPLAWEAAQAEARCVRYGGRPIYIALDYPAAEEGIRDARWGEELTALQDAVASNSATLLAETDQYYFVLVQAGLDVSTEGGTLRRAPVFRIPVDSVLLARTTARALPSQAKVPWGVSCDI